MKKEELLHDMKYRALRLKEKQLYYFDDAGIYKKIPVEENDMKRLVRGVYIFNRNHYVESYTADGFHANVIRTAARQMQVGENFDKFWELLKKLKVTAPKKEEGVKWFVCSIEDPVFYRTPENRNQKTFDFIYVDVIIAAFAPNKEAYIQKYRKEIFKMVLERIAANPQFKKFEIPVNALSLARATLIKKSIIQIIIEIKKVL